MQDPAGDQDCEGLATILRGLLGVCVRVSGLIVDVAPPKNSSPGDFRSRNHHRVFDPGAVSPVENHGRRQADRVGDGFRQAALLVERAKVEADRFA